MREEERGELEASGDMEELEDSVRLENRRKS